MRLLGPAFRYAPQLALFGKPPVIGFGASDFYVERIPKAGADALIAEHHYARSAVWSSNEHLGVFIAGTMAGVLQFGPGMNPTSGARVVAGTEPDGWLELNRMWLSDDAPHGVASRAISYALRYLRQARPRVQWVQSFADERCGKFGGVYQACSFLYLGEHATTFYLLDGEWFHQSMLGRAEYDARGWWSGPKIARLRANRDRAEAHTFRQFRYLRPLTARARRNVLLPVLPYPKPAREFPLEAEMRRVGMPYPPTPALKALVALGAFE